MEFSSVKARYKFEYIFKPTQSIHPLSLHINLSLNSNIGLIRRKLNRTYVKYFKHSNFIDKNINKCLLLVRFLKFLWLSFIQKKSDQKQVYTYYHCYDIFIYYLADMFFIPFRIQLFYKPFFFNELPKNPTRRIDAGCFFIIFRTL